MNPNEQTSNQDWPSRVWTVSRKLGLRQHGLRRSIGERRNDQGSVQLIDWEAAKKQLGESRKPR